MFRVGRMEKSGTERKNVMGRKTGGGRKGEKWKGRKGRGDRKKR